MWYTVKKYHDKEDLMRKTAKVFLILSMIWGGLALFTGGISTLMGSLDVGIISMVNGFVALSVSFVALRKLSRAKTRRELRLIGIITLLFGNTVAGILFLTMNEYELGDERERFRQNPYGFPPYGQPPYGQPPYGQSPYGQPPYGQPPYGQAPYGQRQNPNVPPYGGAYGAPYAAKPNPTPDTTPVDETPMDETPVDETVTETYSDTE